MYKPNEKLIMVFESMIFDQRKHKNPSLPLNKKERIQKELRFCTVEEGL